MTVQNGTMSSHERVDTLVQSAGSEEPDDINTAPFPDSVPTLEPERISLGKLLDGDEAEARRLFHICTTTGYFYLHMLDHATGRQLWQSARGVRDRGRSHFTTLPLEEKLRYRPLGGTKVYDRGYVLRTADQDGQPAKMEILNIPQSELFGTKLDGQAIPSWLIRDQDMYKDALSNANAIARAMLSILERQIGLPTGSLVNLHRLTDDSGGFVRVLRYPGVAHEQEDGPTRFPAHRDAVSIAMLFTWLGGFQIPDPKAKIHGFAVQEEDWRWVRPEPGCALVNLGDAMEIFTNKLLKSVLHRVVKAPGLQRRHDRYSVLFVARPENNTPMKAFESPAIPVCDRSGDVMTSLEWGHSVLSGIRQRAAKEATGRGTSIVANA